MSGQHKQVKCKKMENSLQGQSYEQSPRNTNQYHTPISISGRKVNTMNTFVLTDNSQNTSNKLVLFAMSSGYNRKFLMMLTVILLTAISAYFTITLLQNVAYSEAIITSVFTGVGSYVSIGQFKEFKLLQESKILDARIELLKRTSVIEKGDYDSSLLSLEVSATRNEGVRVATFKEFTKRGDVIDIPLLEQNQEDFATDEELRNDKKHISISNPKIELLQDGFIRVELDETPRHIDRFKALERSYRSRLANGSMSDADKKGLERVTNIIRNYSTIRNQQDSVNVLDMTNIVTADEIGATIKHFRRGKDLFKISGESSDIGKWWSLAKMAKEKNAPMPKPETYNLTVYQVYYPEIQRSEKELAKIVEL